MSLFSGSHNEWIRVVLSDRQHINDIGSSCQRYLLNPFGVWLSSHFTASTNIFGASLVSAALNWDSLSFCVANVRFVKKTVRGRSGARRADIEGWSFLGGYSEPPPHQISGLGERCKLPQCGPGCPELLGYFIAHETSILAKPTPTPIFSITLSWRLTHPLEVPNPPTPSKSNTVM